MEKKDYKEMFVALNLAIEHCGIAIARITKIVKKIQKEMEK